MDEEPCLSLYVIQQSSAKKLKGWLYSMTNYEKVGKLQVAKELYNFVNEEVLLGLEIQKEQFWTNFDSLIHELAPENKALLEKRSELQKKINEWHQNNKETADSANYKEFLKEIKSLGFAVL